MTEPVPEFQLFGPPHLTVLFLTVAIPLVLCLLARRVPPAATIISYGLAAILLANKVAVLSYSIAHNSVPWTQRLPMQLCDWVTFIVAAALIWRKRTLCELAYFWGLAGTLQATITPDLPFGFPHFYFFTFNISHSFILIGVAYMTFGGGNFRPVAGSIIRAFLWLQVYLGAAVATNLLLDENYGYLCRKPLNPSLLDHLGPWPWYILSLEVLALVFFAAYYLPWWVYDKIKPSTYTGSI